MILMISSASDMHAIIVRDTLKSIGVESQILSAFGFPSQEPISVKISGQSADCQMRLDTEFPTIWYRRNAAIKRLESVSPERMDAIEQEYISARRAFYSVLETSNALWVNDWKSAWAAENKALQLRMAGAVGFFVPETLISNDPIKIREFCAQHQENGVIHKMFHQARFGSKASCTARVTPEVLRNDKLLSDVPGIYQPCIDLEFDLRILVAGKSFISARLQSSGNAYVDSRILNHRKGNVHPFELNENTKRLCLDLMDKLGIVSASIDLGVKKDGSIVFFEANQAGNFLWMEQANEELPVLDFYCRFLMSHDIDFEYKCEPGSRLALTSFAN